MVFNTCPLAHALSAVILKYQGTFKHALKRAVKRKGKEIRGGEYMGKGRNNRALERRIEAF